MASTKSMQSYRLSRSRQSCAHDPSENNRHRRRLRVTQAIGSALRLHVEAIESRILLSAYVMTQVADLATNASGAGPRSTLVADVAGNLYGTAANGGGYALGSVFEIAKDSSTITTLASFNGINGDGPVGITLDASGNIYGTSYGSSAHPTGTLFEIAKGTGTITTLVAFSPAIGQPNSAPSIDAFGDFYGTTNNRLGSVFEVKNGSSTATTVASFNGTNGEAPKGGVMIDASGNLFGATAGSGGSTYGTIFEIPAGSNTITTLVSFDRMTTGSGPYITFDGSGNIFGTTTSGGTPPPGYAGYGTVFEVAKGSSTITTFATFIGDDGANPTGATPVGAPTLDASGNLYGMTSSGGTSNDGTVFEVAKGSNTITTLTSFNGTNGLTPGGGVTLDASGNLYGTTYKAGAHNTGTFFEIAGGSSTLTTVASFDSTSGMYPYGGVTLDRAGNLYGTTSAGGDNNDGTVFEIAKGSNASTALACFNGTNGANPEAGLTMDSSGNLFGTTYGGSGNVSGGTVFEIAKGSNTITTLATFTNTGAWYPRGEVTFDAFGNLYGTTNSGGTGQSLDGTVYELAKGSSAITILAAFNGSNGAEPFGSLALDAAGNLFGTTAYGGPNNDGTVFEIVAGSKSITTLASFDGTNGSRPEAGPTMDAAGNLYGTTYSGTVFKLANGSNTITTIASIPGPVVAGITLDAFGNLFGTTAPPGGASTSGGTVFEIPAGSNTANALASLASTFQTFSQAQVGGVTLDAKGDLLGMIEYGGSPSSTISNSGSPLGVGAVFELVAVPAVTLTLTGGANPSITSQPLTFTAGVDSGVPDGEPVTLIDAGNSNTVLATGALNGGSATLNVPAGTLSPGAHNLIAVYGGDANFGASQSTAFAQNVLPAWMAAGSQATWNPSTHTLTVTGAAVINADPGSDEPTIVENGATAQLVIQPASSPTDVHVGAIALTSGAKLQVASVGAGRTRANHNVLVVGTAGSANDPMFSIDYTSKLDLADNDLVVHVAASHPTGVADYNIVFALAKSGRHGDAGVPDGTWNGFELSSSSAAAADAIAGYETIGLAVVTNSSLVTGPLPAWTVGSASENLAAGDLLVKYTYLGDYLLEGQVGDDDAAVLQGEYDRGTSNTHTWATGSSLWDGLSDDNEAAIMQAQYGLGIKFGPQL